MGAPSQLPIDFPSLCIRKRKAKLPSRICNEGFRAKCSTNKADNGNNVAALYSPYNIYTIWMSQSLLLVAGVTLTQINRRQLNNDDGDGDGDGTRAQHLSIAIFRNAEL